MAGLSCAHNLDSCLGTTYFQVHIHGRGGQGTVTAAELLSVAAFDEGRHAQAFPASARSGLEQGRKFKLPRKGNGADGGAGGKRVLVVGAGPSGLSAPRRK